MDPMIIQYLLFILVALCLIVGVIALNRWIYRHTPPISRGPFSWARFDPGKQEYRDVPVRTTRDIEEEDEEDEEEIELHVRASQNGHSSNGHHPL